MRSAHVSSVSVRCRKPLGRTETCICRNHKLRKEASSDKTNVSECLLELPHSCVLEHVAAQVRLSRETTTAASNCAHAGALRVVSKKKITAAHLWIISAHTRKFTFVSYLPRVHSLMLLQPPLADKSCATLGTVQHRALNSFLAAHSVHFLQISERVSNYGHAAAFLGLCYSLLEAPNC